ncbi:hypothetical protein BX600DRAFT_439403 [Xylariales sp. PMI_506]|nr:hypothetical protein BX600DRAFT_439403 [Xylariales sp. PMI_506]
MFELRDAVFLIELAFYCPIIPALIFIILIHGGKKPYTWRPIIIPLLILATLRIAGAAMGLSSLDPGKAGNLTTATLLDTIGLAPVLCVILGLLIRANAPLLGGLPFWAFVPVQLIAATATIMTAYGGRDLYSASADHQSEDLTLMQIGIYLFITTFTITIFLTIATMLMVNQKQHRTERMATICAMMTIPFMSVRLAFSVGSMFSGDGTVLNPVSDDDTQVWLHFLMVVCMEYLATLSATAVALTSRRMTPPPGAPVAPDAGNPDKDGARAAPVDPAPMVDIPIDDKLSYLSDEVDFKAVKYPTEPSFGRYPNEPNDVGYAHEQNLGGYPNEANVSGYNNELSGYFNSNNNENTVSYRN